jgi:hypothetical protein
LDQGPIYTRSGFSLFSPPKIATYFWMLMLGHVSLLERVARWISEPSA